MTGAVRRANLVIVDNDPAIIRLLECYLLPQFEGRIIIQSFTDSDSACQSIRKTRCDILLCDIELPGIDGFEILRLARHCNAWSRVICMTAHSTWDRIAVSLENGACDYLLKPVDPDVLLEVVEQEWRRLGRWHQALRNSSVECL